MVRIGNRLGKVAAALWFVLVVVGGNGGCATIPTGGAQEKVIWKAGDQYVKIEKQDRPTGVTEAANSHPADVSVDRLRSMLASIELRFPDKDKAVPLFYDDELKILSENIRAGLAAAGSDEDVTFAVIGHYPVLMGFLKERAVTTGRLFCQGGELNIVFGDVHRLVRENEDRRLHPFLPGSRTVAASGEWTLATSAGGESFVLKRSDWVTFPLAAPPAPAARNDAGSIGGGGKTSPAVVPPGKPATTGKKSVEERLMLLNDLRSKKLITDEEYRAKRREILDEL